MRGKSKLNEDAPPCPLHPHPPSPLRTASAGVQELCVVCPARAVCYVVIAALLPDRVAMRLFGSAGGSHAELEAFCRL